MIGPVLVQQDHSDAKSNVDTRLGFIRGEMCALKRFRIPRMLTPTQKKSRGTTQRHRIQIRSQEKRSQYRYISNVDSVIDD